MARIIPFSLFAHRDLRLLLPWYATGSLTDVERARVEAHLATCAECRAELQTDRRLHEAVAGLPFDAEAGWLRLRARMARNDVGMARRLLKGITGTPVWVKWALGGQAALAAAALLVLGLPPLAQYETLSAPTSPPSAEILVVFHPETTERQLRAILRAADARLVGGPTAADAYLLDAGPAGPDAALALLRRRSEVAIAAPLKPDTARPGAAR